MIFDVLAMIMWWEWILLGMCWAVGLLSFWAPRVHIYVLQALKLAILFFTFGTFGATMQKYGLLSPDDSFYGQILIMIPFLLLWAIGHAIVPVWCPVYNAQVDIQKKMIQMQRSLVPLFLFSTLLMMKLIFAYAAFVWPEYVQQYWHYLCTFSFLIIGSLHGFLFTYVMRYEQERRRAQKRAAS